jgi:glycosyltransferase involved in cell wall biosynthesis
VLAPHEVLIVDAQSTDGTVAAASPYGQVLTVRLSRGAGRNQAAAQASGEVLLVLHADTALPAGAAA